MGAAVGSALKPARGRGDLGGGRAAAQATSKRAELADLVAVPDVAGLARRVRRDRLGVPAARRAGRSPSRSPRPSTARRGAEPDLRRRQRRLPGDRAGHRRAARPGRASWTGRSSGRRRGSRAPRCCGCPGRRPPTSPRCSPARRSTPACWAPSWARRARSRRASRCRARRCRRSGWRWPRRRAATASSDALRGELDRHRRRLRRGAGRGRARGREGVAVGGGDGGGGATPWPRRACPTGSAAAAAEIYRRLADGRLAP